MFWKWGRSCPSDRVNFRSAATKSPSLKMREVLAPGRAHLRLVLPQYRHWNENQTVSTFPLGSANLRQLMQVPHCRVQISCALEFLTRSRHLPWDPCNTAKYSTLNFCIWNLMVKNSRCLRTRVLLHGHGVGGRQHRTILDGSKHFLQCGLYKSCEARSAFYGLWDLVVFKKDEQKFPFVGLLLIPERINCNKNFTKCWQKCQVWVSQWVLPITLLCNSWVFFTWVFVRVQYVLHLAGISRSRLQGEVTVCAPQSGLLPIAMHLQSWLGYLANAWEKSAAGMLPMALSTASWKSPIFLY